MAIYMGDILIQGSFPPQVHLYAQGATLLFMVLGWSLIWVKDVSFPNLLATHLDLYPSWHVFACSISLVLDSVRIFLHTILYSTVKSYKCEGVGQIIYFFFETTAPEYSGWEVCHP